MTRSGGVHAERDTGVEDCITRFKIAKLWLGVRAWLRFLIKLTPLRKSTPPFDLDQGPAGKFAFFCCGERDICCTS